MRTHPSHMLSPQHSLSSPVGQAAPAPDLQVVHLFLQSAERPLVPLLHSWEGGGRKCKQAARKGGPHEEGLQTAPCAFGLGESFSRSFHFFAHRYFSKSFYNKLSQFRWYVYTTRLERQLQLTCSRDGRRPSSWWRDLWNCSKILDLGVGIAPINRLVYF